MKTWYLFNCPEHGQFDLRLDSEEDNLRAQPCPTCQAEAPRTLTAPMVKFEGPGFHVNDYRGK